MACQVFHSGLTKKQSKDIESIQKKALKIILGEHYSGYEEASTLLSAEPLSDRRESLCRTFVKRCVKSGLHTDIFSPASSSCKTRSGNNLLNEYMCNTKCYFKSPLVYLSRVYNQYLKKWLTTVLYMHTRFTLCSFCFWWTMGAGPSTLYCTRWIWVHWMLCTVSYHLFK